MQSNVKIFSICYNSLQVRTYKAKKQFGQLVGWLITSWHKWWPLCFEGWIGLQLKINLYHQTQNTNYCCFFHSHCNLSISKLQNWKRNFATFTMLLWCCILNLGHSAISSIIQGGTERNDTDYRGLAMYLIFGDNRYVFCNSLWYKTWISLWNVSCGWVFMVFNCFTM